ncbi:hypothetical protein MLD38_035778 [Melastoma candidum]|uniref:Uncharacterized protein n=1 Tax=Melastoma candidum TaxID=119954 RepID=A0ACB9LHM4_9MYRT|nr:hypothetical protein MLD38_035778 [Melastoma candidum]
MSPPPFLLPLLLLLTLPFPSFPSPTVCIVGGGIGGSSLSHFIRRYSAPQSNLTLRVFERNAVVGGRMATVTIAGHTFEAGGSILHPKNYYARNFSEMIGQRRPGSERSEDGDRGFGIWDGERFLLRSWSVDSMGGFPFAEKMVSLLNDAMMFFRYGFSLFKMKTFVEETVGRFLKYYECSDSRPVFETVDEMLKWSGLYNLTTHTLEEELISIGLSPLLINELITVITRINYGQSVRISGLAGAVSMAGSGEDLWAVKGGNWRMAAGLLNQSDVLLHLQEEIVSVSDLGTHYALNSSAGNSYICEVAVVATPLDEVDIEFHPPISIPKRKLQHTHATFVRGVLNPAYFGLKTVVEIPDLIGSIEDPSLPFSSISVLKRHGEKDMTYKVFSRQATEDTLLDEIFSARQETIRINWGAYPHFDAPEVFAPIILDGRHLYYINAFENAASTMETSAVAAENVARLILLRLHGGLSLGMSDLRGIKSDPTYLHSDL